MLISVSSWQSGLTSKSLGIFIDKQLRTIDETVIHLSVNRTQCNKVSKSGNVIYINIYNDTGVRILDLICKIILYNFYLFYISKIRFPNKLNLLINVLYHIGIFIAPFIYLTNIRYSVNEHWSGYLDEDGSYDKQSYLYKKIISRLLKKSNCVSVPSPYLKNRIVDLFNIRGDLVFVVPNVVNTIINYYPVKRLSRNIISGFIIGNLNDLNKNVISIIKLDDTMFKLGISEYEFYIIGNCKNEIKNTLNCKNTVLVNYVDNLLIQRYFGVHSYINLSRFETFSISVAQSVLTDNNTFITNSGGPLTYLNNKLSILFERGNYYCYLNNLISSNKRKYFSDRDIKQRVLLFNVYQNSDFVSLGELLRHY